MFQYRSITSSVCTRPLRAHAHWINTPTECTRPLSAHAHWMYTPTECTHPLNVHAHWVHTPTECTHPLSAHAHWMYMPTECTRPQYLTNLAPLPGTPPTYCTQVAPNPLATSPNHLDNKGMSSRHGVCAYACAWVITHFAYLTACVHVWMMHIIITNCYWSGLFSGARFLAIEDSECSVLQLSHTLSLKLYWIHALLINTKYKRGL